MGEKSVVSAGEIERMNTGSTHKGYIGGLSPNIHNWIEQDRRGAVEPSEQVENAGGTHAGTDDKHLGVSSGDSSDPSSIIITAVPHTIGIGQVKGAGWLARAWKMVC